MIDSTTVERYSTMNVKQLAEELQTKWSHFYGELPSGSFPDELTKEANEIDTIVDTINGKS